MEGNLYDVLGVDKRASDEQIRDAFKEKAKENHPDKDGGDNERMSDVNRAYMVLRDKVKRDRYDKTGETEEVAFDVKFAGFVNEIFMKIVDTQNEDMVDLVELFLDTAVMHRGQVEMAKREMVKKMRKCEKVLRRLKGEKIAGVVRMNVSMFKMEIAKMDAEIKFLVDAAEVIAHSDYEFEIE